jgi:5-methylcytosine-specific restriction endonuclease McrA
MRVSDYCIHVEQQIVWSQDAIGRKHLRRQCLDCGHLVGSALPASGAKPDTPWADTEKEANYRAVRQAEIDIKIQEDRDRYAAYRLTPKWQAIRSKVLDRAKGVCEGCRSAPAALAHHLTYAHIGDELLFELVALCRPCHERAHNLSDDGDRP